MKLDEPPHPITRARAAATNFGQLSHSARDLLRLLSAIRARPSAVFGPLDSPPCSRHRFLPRTARALQGVPPRVFAPHTGRRFFGVSERRHSRISYVPVSGSIT